ncbi:hypothetical protein LINPERPRIM_LOCUS32696 [Linum perenne]
MDSSCAVSILDGQFNLEHLHAGARHEVQTYTQAELDGQSYPYLPRGKPYGRSSCKPRPRVEFWYSHDEAGR